MNESHGYIAMTAEIHTQNITFWMISFSHVRNQNNGFPYNGIFTEKKDEGNVENVVIFHLNCTFTVCVNSPVYYT